MSTTEDTSAIDEKKAEDSGIPTTSPDFKGFMINYFSSILFTIGISIFIIGGLGLYTTKVAQANILPDNIEEAPYTVFDRIVKDIPVDINIMRPSFFSDYKSCLSQKAYFNSQEYLDSFNKSFLCSLKKASDPNSGIFANGPLYFSFVYDNIVAKNFLAITNIFLYFSYLPESIFMILYGFFGIFLWIGLYFFNFLISIFYHIVNIPQLFRTVSKNDNKKWQSMESISFFNIMKLILFFIFYIPVGFISAVFMPIFFTLYGLICPLYATYHFKQSKQKLNIYDFLKDTFAYKKLFFFILSTVSLFTNGYKFLGSNSIVGIVIAVFFAYLMGLYNNEMPDAGNDGFTFKIKSTVVKAKVQPRDLINPSIINICPSIPIDDDKINVLIDNGTKRELSIPEDSIEGGDNNFQPIMVQTSKPSDIYNNASAPVDDINNQLPSYNENMTGGKKKSKYINKKYNIRWT